MRPLVLREMMFGTRERFAYLECEDCGCVQIAEYPSDIGRFYGDNYYSLQPDEGLDWRAPTTLQRAKVRLRDLALAHVPGLWQRHIAKPATQAWLQRKPVVKLYTDRLPPDARILDVGCGSGRLLIELGDVGFARAEGIDPFIDRDIYHQGRRLVRKLGLQEVDARFHCISLNHALEHMPDQPGVFRELHRLLEPGGLLIIRVPVTGGLAWRTYRENWVQLDPPRHFYVHSVRSLEMLARRCGFSSEEVTYDSTGIQFWASELYMRDVPLVDAVGGRVLFSEAELAAFESRAQALNAARDGDQVAAFFRRD
ncbi:class I SAM-dependent methyltransferase [Falsiroseomonas oryzae]|uniref:class I SAM-dependent methyltransferase n=1 Tax=Falsiroseomonas oryzae TaxID=2766473 RepID=UPI0022EB2DE0|nr:class I SAM-dependent methyltransferase [Roseomonas sp. MO-31]